MNQDEATATKKPRRAAALWGSGAIAAVVLVLGVNGTLSSWTSALITNDNNSAGATSSYLALVETDGANTCDTTTSPNNTIAACSSINKYGGTSTMSPGDSEVVAVTFTNPGTADGNTFSYAPGACTPTNGTGGINLCTDGDLTVAVACSTGITYNAGNAIAALGQSGTPGTLVSKSWTAAPALGSASATAVTCRFTTTLDASAPPVDAGSQVAQPITWTLDAV
ncbi:MAG: hypothetical protein ACJ72O_17215 [Marmoricola sp.]